MILTLKVFRCEISHEIWKSKLEWMGYISAKFRDFSSRTSWFAHHHFLPPSRSPARPGGNHSTIYLLMRPKNCKIVFSIFLSGLYLIV